MKMRLKEKVIVIAGGTKGVGKAAAISYAQEGAHVIIGGRDTQAADMILKANKSCVGKSMFVHSDLSKTEDCKFLFDTAFNTYGRVDGFFHYAGITPVSPLDSCSEKTFDDVMTVNFKSCFFCCQQAIKYMRLSCGGSIVLTGSAHAWGGQKDRAAYACSKGALLTLMEHIAHNYANEHIRCNYFTLGWTPTEGEISLRESLGESGEQLMQRASNILPMGRMCKANDYTEALIYLMSNQSEMMTGSNFRITGGEYI